MVERPRRLEGPVGARTIRLQRSSGRLVARRDRALAVAGYRVAWNRHGVPGRPAIGTFPNVVPAFLCIDVEPDAHNPTLGDRRPWAGFARMVEFVERLRGTLADRSGEPFHATWFLRMDPIIERCFGRSDFAVHRHPVEIERVQSRGDAMGIHPHAHRWDRDRGAFSEYADLEWATHCVTSSASAFEECFGVPPRRCRHGGFFMAEPVIDAAVDAGVRVDCTPEPGLRPLNFNPSFGFMATGASTDFIDFPRHPYRPSRSCVGRIGTGDDVRALTVIPLSSFDYQRALSPLHRRLAKRALRWPDHPQTLNPWKRWPSPSVYWDLMARSVGDVPIPFVSLAIRTDEPGSANEQRARAILEELTRHPISKQLQWSDPLALAEPV